MKKLLFAAISASTLLGAAAASAQGLPVGTTPPNYGSVWSANKIASERQNPSTLASNQVKAHQPTVAKTAEGNVNPSSAANTGS